MTKLEKYIVTFSIVISVVTLCFLMSSPHKETSSFGSVSIGSEYHSTTTRAFNGIPLATTILNSTGPGVLGSVVITGTSTGVINIYDATSTITNSQYGTTTIASFPASTATGTYTFDSLYYRGLVVEVIGTVATSTITYR